MCQNSIIECLFGVARLTLPYSWAPTRTEKFGLVRDIEVLVFLLSTIFVEYV